MEEKKGFGEKLNEFFAGKGFYIVLLLCAALIGTSIWLMTDGSRTDVEAAGGEMTNAAVGAGKAEINDDAVAAMQVNGTPRPDTQRGSQPTPTADPGADREPSPAPEAPQVAEEPETGTVPNPEQVQTTMEAVDYFIWPVNGVLLRGHSLEALSYDPTMADWRLHSGWDIAAEPGAQVLCTANGAVSAVYEDGQLGHVVEVSHSNGLVSVYANLAEEIPVVVGQNVSVGSVLGTVGRSARSEIGEAGHLHFAMRMNGETADPTDWLPKP